MLKEINKKIVKKFKNLGQDCKGQMLVMAAFSIFSLVLFWYTIINVGKMTRNRILVGNAADNAAQTWATNRARIYNILGALGGELAGKMTFDCSADNLSEGAPFGVGCPSCIYPKQADENPPAPCGSYTHTDYRDELVGNMNTINDRIDNFMDLAPDYAENLATRAALKTLDSMTGDYSGFMSFFEAQTRFMGDVYVDVDGGDLNLEREEFTVDVYATKTFCYITSFSPFNYECDFYPTDPESPDQEVSWPYIENEDAFRDGLSVEVTVEKDGDFFGNIGDFIEGADLGQLGTVGSKAEAIVYHTQIEDDPMFQTNTPQDGCCATCDHMNNLCDTKDGGWKGTLVEPND